MARTRPLCCNTPPPPAPVDRMGKVTIYLDSYDPAAEAQVVRRLARAGRMDEAHVRALLARGPLRLAHGVDAAVAEKFHRLLAPTGASLRVEPQRPAWWPAALPGRLRTWARLAAVVVPVVVLAVALFPLPPRHAPASVPTVAAGSALSGPLWLETTLSTLVPGDSPVLWLEVELTDAGAILPPEADLARLFEVDDIEVAGHAGQSLYDPDHPIEQQPSRAVPLTRGGEGQLSGLRQIHLRRGTRKEDVAYLHASARLYLPAGLTRLFLHAPAQGHEESVGGVRLLLTELSAREATLSVSGTRVPEHLAGAVGTAGSTMVRPLWTSLFEQGGEFQYNLGFAEPIEGLRVLLAERREVRMLDLRLELGAKAGLVVEDGQF